MCLLRPNSVPLSRKIHSILSIMLRFWFCELPVATPRKSHKYAVQIFNIFGGGNGEERMTSCFAPRFRLRCFDIRSGSARGFGAPASILQALEPRRRLIGRSFFRLHSSTQKVANCFQFIPNQKYICYSFEFVNHLSVTWICVVEIGVIPSAASAKWIINTAEREEKRNGAQLIYFQCILESTRQPTADSRAA